MSFEQELALQMTRRRFFGRGAKGIGSLALATLLREDLFGDTPGKSSRILNPLHFAPTAKRIIYLFMSGAPSQLDLFDPKPKLVEMTGEPMPESVTQGQRIAQLAGRKLVCVGSKFQFRKHGRSAPRCPSFCRTWPASPTIWPSYARCIPTPSTTTRPSP